MVYRRDLISGGLVERLGLEPFVERAHAELLFPPRGPAAQRGEASK
ncbi:MAG TPA: hypothetical protein VFR04_04120 [Solirubrobacterales bacterium]|nr:hypothetical protein [Solirubrobacterales bacterium]